MSLFKKPTKKKQRHLRERIIDNDDSTMEEEAEIACKLEGVKELQESRVRKNGLNAVECALGKELAAEFIAMDDDPFRQRGGGMLRLSEGRQAQMHAADIEAGIRDQFKKESFLRDEHEEMKKYVQAELRKRKAVQDLEDNDATTSKVSSMEDTLMWKAAEKVRLFRSERNDELLSNQMLAGIPEVDLGINARMSNIIETEKKKSDMLKEVVEKRRNLAQDSLFSQDRAKDLAKDYVQHSIFYMESTTRLGQEDWRKKLERPDTEAQVTLTDADNLRSDVSIHQYRQCFTLYCPKGCAQNASHLRYIMRSLGYTPTTPETIEYFRKYGQQLDFPCFLEILHQENQKGDPIKEIIDALRGIDSKKQNWITVPEFIGILSSVGEKMSREEIYNILQQLDITGGRVPFSSLLNFISNSHTDYTYFTDNNH
ncbi:Hepatocellular carcinoma-associated antigen 59 family protein [Brugia pahangi]